MIIELKKLIVLLILVLIANFQNFGQSIPPTAPVLVSATPSSLTCGGSSNLIANTSGGNVIVRWWTASTGGVLLCTSLSGGVYAVTPSSTTTFYAEAFDTTTGLSSVSRAGINVTIIPLSSPTNVLVFPNPVQCGNNTNLFANSLSGTIRWWDAPTGGNLVGSTQGGVFFNFTPTNSIIYYAESYFVNPINYTFFYNGLIQTFIVPSGVTTISVDAFGASGGTTSTVNSLGGLGGRIQASLNVAPGQSLYIFVGGQGSNFGSGGWNGGGNGVTGGGGASDIRIGGTSFLNRVVVAGGGGGGGVYNNGGGGAGGGLIGANGLWNSTYSTFYCGEGGSQTAGGAGSANSLNYPGSFGEMGIGGEKLISA